MITSMIASDKAVHEVAKLYMSEAFCAGVHTGYRQVQSSVMRGIVSNANKVRQGVGKPKATGFEGETDQAIRKNYEELIHMVATMDAGMKSIKY